MQALSALWTVSLEIPIMSPVDSAQTMGSDERRLVAIFAADVAGYSRLMRADEQGTLRALQADREIIDSSSSPSIGAGSPTRPETASSPSSRAWWTPYDAL